MAWFKLKTENWQLLVVWALLIGSLLLGLEWNMASNAWKRFMFVEKEINQTVEEVEHGHFYDELFNPMLRSVHVSFGQYDGCAASGAPIVWFVSSGHYRSFSMRYPNYESFVGIAPCRFEIIYTRERVEAEGSGWWGDRDAEAGDHINDVPLDLLHQYSSNRSNIAYHVVKQEQKIFDQYAGPVMLVKAVAAHHNIKLDPAQLYVYTRPDVMPSHALDLHALYEFSSQVETRNWLVVTPHEAGRIGGQDPSDLFLVGNAGFFMEKFDAEEVRAVISSASNGTCRYGMDCCLYPREVWEFGCNNVTEVSENPPKQTRMPSTWFVHDGVCHDTTTVVMGPTMKLRVLRLSGETKTGINRPVTATKVDPQQPVTNTPVDITMWDSGERQVIRGRHEKSKCWERIQGTQQLLDWEARWSDVNNLAKIKEDDYVYYLQPFLKKL